MTNDRNSTSPVFPIILTIVLRPAASISRGGVEEQLALPLIQPLPVAHAFLRHNNETQTVLEILRRQTDHAVAGNGFNTKALAAARPVLHVLPAEGGAGINRALAALRKSGGEVVLSACTYLILTTIITRSDNITLRGAGPDTLLRLVAQTNCPVLVVGDEANKPRRTVSSICVADIRTRVCGRPCLAWCCRKMWW